MQQLVAIRVRAKSELATDLVLVLAKPYKQSLLVGCLSVVDIA
jgi:hypothetical protein